MKAPSRVVMTHQSRYPTIGDLRLLKGRRSGDKATGADALKQFYLWRQDEWNVIPQALMTAALSLIGAAILSLLKTTDFKADPLWVVLAILVAFDLTVTAAGSLMLWRMWVGREYIVAMEFFQQL